MGEVHGEEGLSYPIRGIQEDEATFRDDLMGQPPEGWEGFDILRSKDFETGQTGGLLLPRSSSDRAGGIR